MIKEQEAFVYLWYDAPNKKYYLGKHKGTPDDSYTHSSTIWESFTKDTIPEGVTRLILAYGTDEKMCVLEHELLVNRKKRCWDRYYNESLGDPRYVDISGENNPMYKHGRAVGVHHDIEARRVYEKSPERVTIEKQRQNTKEYKDKQAQYEKTPKCRVYRRKYRDLVRAKNKAERQGVGTLDQFMG